jgi:hypothetical protein
LAVLSSSSCQPDGALLLSKIGDAVEGSNGEDQETPITPSRLFRLFGGHLQPMGRRALLASENGQYEFSTT